MLIYPFPDPSLPFTVGDKFTVLDGQVARINVDGLPEGYVVAFEEAAQQRNPCGSDIVWVFPTSCCCDPLYYVCDCDTITHFVIPGMYRPIIIRDDGGPVIAADIELLRVFVRVINDPHGIYTTKFLEDNSMAGQCGPKTSFVCVDNQFGHGVNITNERTNEVCQVFVPNTPVYKDCNNDVINSGATLVTCANLTTSLLGLVCSQISSFPPAPAIGG